MSRLRRSPTRRAAHRRPGAPAPRLLPQLRSLLLPAVVAGLACAGGPTPLPAPTVSPDVPLEQHQLRDRVVAIVDEEAILLSDVEEVIGLGLVVRQEGDSDETLQMRALGGIVDQRLRYRTAERYGFGQVSVDDIERQLQAIRERFPSGEAFRERLGSLGLTEAELRQLLARQLLVLRYVDERLGARVFVSLSDIRTYYEDELVPQLTDQGQPVPPLEEVREEIREVIKQRRLLEEVERWTRELRQEADVQIFLDEPLRELPPLRARIGPPPPS